MTIEDTELDTQAAEDDILADLVGSAGIESDEPEEEAEPASLEGGLDTPPDELLIAAAEEQFGEAEAKAIADASEPDSEPPAAAAPAARNEQPQAPTGSQLEAAVSDVNQRANELVEARRELQGMADRHEINQEQLQFALQNSVQVEQQIRADDQQIRNVQGHLALQQQQQQFNQQQQHAQALSDSNAEIAKDFPAWGNPADRAGMMKKANNWLKDQGLSEAEIGGMGVASVKLVLRTLAEKDTRLQRHAKNEALKLKQKAKQRKKTKLQNSTQQLANMGGGSGGITSTSSKIDQVASLIAGL